MNGWRRSIVVGMVSRLRRFVMTEIVEIVIGFVLVWGVDLSYALYH